MVLIEGMLDDTIRWSVATSKLIGVGEEIAQAWERPGGEDLL